VKFLMKISYFGQIFKPWQKFQFLVKNCFWKNKFNFWLKFHFLGKLRFLFICHKFRFLVNFWRFVFLSSHPTLVELIQKLFVCETFHNFEFFEQADWPHLLLQRNFSHLCKFLFLRFFCDNLFLIFKKL